MTRYSSGGHTPDHGAADVFVALCRGFRGIAGAWYPVAMFVVIFRAKVRAAGDEYACVAGRLRELALSHFGCLEFVSVSEGLDEIALSYWPDQDSIRAWKQHSEHILAQELGRERWYESYLVQVAAVGREYRWPRSTPA